MFIQSALAAYRINAMHSSTTTTDQSADSHPPCQLQTDCLKCTKDGKNDQSILRWHLSLNVFIGDVHRLHSISSLGRGGRARNVGKLLKGGIRYHPDSQKLVGIHWWEAIVGLGPRRHRLSLLCLCQSGHHVHT